MASDVLAIPIFVVASESAFSIEGCVLDQFRSSLTSRIVQALICVQDWLRASKMELSVEEKWVNLEEFKSGKLSTLLFRNLKYFFNS